MITDIALKHPEFSGLHFTGSTSVFRDLWKKIRMLRRKRRFNAFNGHFCWNDAQSPNCCKRNSYCSRCSNVQEINKSKAIVVVFFGDAAVEEGVFHESANFASLHNLPILFVCENNRYSCFTDLSERQPSEDLTRLAKSHNIESIKMNGNDVIKVFNQSQKLLKN